MKHRKKRLGYGASKRRIYWKIGGRRVPPPEKNSTKYDKLCQYFSVEKEAG